MNAFTRTITEEALAARIRRALKKQSEFLTLKKSRSQRMRQDVGDWYVLDVNHNCIVDRYLNLEDYARELEVLADHEVMEQEAA